MRSAIEVIQMQHPLTQLHETGPKSHEPNDWAEWLIEQIRTVNKHGLPEAYGGDAYSFVCDFWGSDMPWTEPLTTRVAAAVETHAEFETLRAAFQERFDRDIWEEDSDEAKAQA